jgi:predicted flap endonuclease-1-like 5' DNA nuclease
MLGALVFIASFLFLFVATIMFPNIPPGQIICNILGNSETNDVIAGVPGELLVAATINGLVWGVIIAIAYSYLRGPQKGKVTLPVWIPGYTTSRSSTIDNKAPKKEEDKPAFKRIRKTQIETIKGIDYIYGRRLRELGIETIDDLIEAGSTADGQKQLANIIGVKPPTILNWVQQAEATRQRKTS